MTNETTLNAPTLYPLGKITDNRAWKLTEELFGKAPPYRGYACDLGNGQMLVHGFKDEGFRIETLKGK